MTAASVQELSYDERMARMKRIAVYVDCDPEHLALVKDCLGVMLDGLEVMKATWSTAGPVELDKASADVVGSILDVADGHCQDANEPWQIRARSIAAISRTFAQEVGPR